MGLYIVKTLVEEKYYGSLMMESNEQIGGTKFIISISISNSGEKNV